MNLERRIVDLMRTVNGDTEAWFGAQPQGDDESPSKLPVIIVQRPDTVWLNEFCGLDPDIAIPVIQIDYWAATAEQARRLADAGRTLMIGLKDPNDNLICPSLQMEESLYEPMARAWRYLQRWYVTDYLPVLSP